MGDPPVAVLPDAQRAEALLLHPLLGLAQRDPFRLRIPALAEIPQPLPVAPPDDRDLAATAQQLEHQPHLASSPPDVVLPLHALVVLDLAREQRAAPLELTQDVAPEGGVLLEELVAAPLPRILVAPAAHPCANEGQILDRPDERSPLEQLPLLPEQAIEFGRVVAVAEPAPEHQVLRRRDGGDRVDLQVAELPDGLEDAARRAVQQLRADGDPPRLLRRDRDPANHALCPVVGEELEQVR